MLHDYVIIGAGLSGLYCAYKLIQKGEKNIIILEKNNYFGGRIKTSTINDTLIELGAGVINGNHKKTLDLLNELNLSNNLKVINSAKQFIFNNKIYNNTEDLDNLLNKVIIEIKNKLINTEFKKKTQSLSLFNLTKTYYNKQIAKLIMYKFGYHADFTDQNAIDGINMFEKDYGPNKFYNLTGGLSQIIYKLQQFITNNNINIISGVTLLDIQKISNYNYICKTSNCDYYGKNIIMAIPKANLIKISYFSNIIDLFDSVQQISHIRIYAKYPILNNSVWFNNMSSYSTNNIINNIIPIDKKNGIIMYYCDNKNAKVWHKLNKIKILDDVLHQIITNIFGKSVPKHNHTVISYEKIGTHVWKPGYNSNELYKKISKPYENENIFIIGESYSNNQQWMIGAIDSVDYLLSKKMKFIN